MYKLRMSYQAKVATTRISSHGNVTKEEPAVRPRWNKKETSIMPSWKKQAVRERLTYPLHNSQRKVKSKISSLSKVLLI